MDLRNIPLLAQTEEAWQAHLRMMDELLLEVESAVRAIDRADKVVHTRLEQLSKEELT